MSRANLKINDKTKRALDDVKRDGETWDECLQRLAQLERATRMSNNEDGRLEQATSPALDEGGGDV